MKFWVYISILAIFLTFSCKYESNEIVHDTDNVMQSDLYFHDVEEIDLFSGKLVRIDSFPSKYIVPRPVDVWLPKDYTETKKYAVLYMHDGQMLFDAKTTWNKQEWKVDEWATQLMETQKTKEFIVVAPHNRREIRKSDYFPQKPFKSLPKKTQDSLFEVSRRKNLTMNTIKSDNYLRFLVKELKPLVDKQFSVYTDKENTVIMGSSMGGLISMYAISEYPDVYGRAACLSTHWTGTYTNINNPIPNAFLEYMKVNLPDSETHKMYFDYGTDTLDEIYLVYQDKVTEVLSEKGFHTNIRFEGANHSEDSWNKRLDIPLTFLLGN